MSCSARQPHHHHATSSSSQAQPPCFECGAGAHEAHHVVPKSRGGTKTVWLCSPCHGKAHGMSGRRGHFKELQREGIERAKAKGKYKGRKPALSPEQAKELCRRVAEVGSNKAALAREFGISRETLYQYCPRGA